MEHTHSNYHLCDSKDQRCIAALLQNKNSNLLVTVNALRQASVHEHSYNQRGWWADSPTTRKAIVFAFIWYKHGEIGLHRMRPWPWIFKHVFLCLGRLIAQSKPKPCWCRNIRAGVSTLILSLILDTLWCVSKFENTALKAFTMMA